MIKDLLVRVTTSRQLVKPQNSRTKVHLLIPTVPTNAFYHVPTNCLAPGSVFKPHTTQNSSIWSDAELTPETSASETVTVIAWFPSNQAKIDQS